MPQQQVLVVDDEEDILERVRHHLERKGCVVSCETSNEAALKRARWKVPDLIVLDLTLPGLDGLEVCRLLKKGRKTGHIPIVMLTAKAEGSDIAAGLELGVDDYVTKPFSPKALVACIRAVLRRRAAGPPGETAILKVRELVITPGRHEVLAAGRRVELTNTEFRILHFLARRPGGVFTRGQIVDAACGEDAAATGRSVDAHIVSLRRKLGPLGKYIETVRGVGYRFKE